MSKKLVKTAKQQFEERLRELNVVREWKMCDTEIYYLCLDSKAHVHLLRDQDGEYKQLSYGQQYEALVFSSRFLCAMSERFVELDIDIKPLFDWYASADHDREPFNLHDIYTCDLGELLFIFKDLYEEVEDDPYATAKEQALRDIEKYGLNKEFDETNGEYFCGDVNGKFVIIVIYSECEPCRYEFAKSREEVYRDKEFQGSIMKYFSSVRGADGVIELFEWTKDTEKQEPFDLYDIINAIEHHGGPATCICYEGTPNPVKQDFKDEMNALRTKMVKHIIELCEQGLRVNEEVLCMNVFLLYADRSYVRTEDFYDFWIGKNDKNEWKAYRTDGNGEWDSALEDFTVETLRNIIEALQ